MRLLSAHGGSALSVGRRLRVQMCRHDVSADSDPWPRSDSSGPELLVPSGLSASSLYLITPSLVSPIRLPSLPLAHNESLLSPFCPGCGGPSQ